MAGKFLLLTDNSGVKYLFNQPDLNARKARWLAFLREFDFEVGHIKGKENKVADPDKEFTVCVDASKERLGGVLTQEEHVIFYESQK